MIHPLVKRSIPVALSAALMIGAVPSVTINAATPTTTNVASTLFSPAAVGKVSIGGGSYIQMEDVQLLGQNVRFTISVANNGTSDLEFIDYWVKMRSVTGSQFTVNLSEADKDKNRIPAKTTETFTFYSSVSANTKLSDLKFDFVRWDFSLASFQRYLGSIRVPVTYNNKTPAGKKLKMLINGTSASALIKKATIAKTSNEYLANLTFVFENTGTKSITLPTYQYTIVTGEGLTYPLEVEGLEDGASIHPRFTKELTLKGSIPASVSMKYYKLMITEKVGEAPAMPVASFVVPPSSAAQAVTSIPVGGKKELVIEDQKVSAQVSRTIRNETDRNSLANITFSFVNNGVEPVSLPKYSFAVKTSDGLTYPITVNLDNTRLDPRIEKEVTLNVTLPNSVGKSGWKLLMQEPVSASKPDGAKTTVATYDLSNDNSSDLKQGSTYKYTNFDGTYDIKLDSVQRVPWEDDDILSTEIIITNSGKASLPVPELTGYFMLDDKIKIDAQTLQKDTVIDIKPNGTIHLTLYSKIPYTYEYSSLKVNLQEKIDNETMANVVEFKNDGDVKSIPVISLGNKHSLEGIGRTAEVSIRDVRSYQGLTNNLFTALVDIKNLEKRSTDVAALVGHFRTKNGLIYPATVSEVSNKVAPSGLATLLVSSSLPLSVDTDGLQLVLGEGVKEGKLAVGSGSDAYVGAVEFKLPAEAKEPKTELSNIVFYPYNVSLGNISTLVVSQTSFLFKFNYQLNKMTEVDVSTDEHKLLIEFEDLNGDIAFSKEFTLGKNTGEHNNGSNDLSIGNYSKEISVPDDMIMFKLLTLRTYKFKVYDLYMGQKKLLAKKELTWFNQ